VDLSVFHILIHNGHDLKKDWPSPDEHEQVTSGIKRTGHWLDASLQNHGKERIREILNFNLTKENCFLDRIGPSQGQKCITGQDIGCF